MDELKPSPPNSSPLTPLGFLERAATVYGDCPSVIFGDTTYTWSQTHSRCLRVASSLAAGGIGRGHVVSVVAPNVPAMYELHFAVPMCGAVLNNINTRLDARTVSVLLRHGGSKLIFVDPQSRALVLEALSMFPPSSDRPLLVLIADDDAVDELGNPLTSSPGNAGFWCTYENLVERGNPDFEWNRPASEWDPMILNYTSGTTSSPKGVIHCHRGIFTIAVDTLVDWAVPKQPVYLWTLPMFHSNGWSFPWGLAAVGGTSICLRKFDAAAIYHLIRRHSVTHMCGAPVVLNMLSSGSGSDADPLKHPVKILTAGAPPPAAVLFRTESLGFEVSHGYGLTETGGLVVSCAWKPQWNRLPAAERARLKARQGVRTVAMTEVEVLDPGSGAPVRRDGSTLGEIVLRGGSVMLGYFKDPEGTAKCMRGGWFYTGDVGVMHPDGYLEIKDRSKDVIISGGENLSSVEVESVLYGHPAAESLHRCGFARRMSNHQSNQYARNNDQSGTQDHAIIYIEDILRGVPPTWPEHSIFRVPHGLRIANEKAYEPKILAVGPYHYRSDRCKFMEKQKLRYVQRLLERRDEGSVHRFMPILREMEEQARDCYAETIHLSQNEFLAMMLIDGCFIVQFLREYSIVINGMNDPQMEADGIPFLSSLQRDLLLLENQLPLFVLNELYDMTRGPKEHPELVDIAISYFSGQPVDLNTNLSLRNSKHLLHLMHTYWTLGLPNAHQLIGSTAPTEERHMLNSSATELRDAGVRLRAAAQEQHFMDIKFENGILEIPVFTAEDCAESQFRNLIAYEQLHQCGDISYVTEYISFMDSLINTSKDVELLRRQGIIRNYLGDDEAVAQMFNKMGDCVTLNDSYYNETSRKVNAYCNKKGNVWMAKLRREYFHSPWALLSVLAAIVLLLLTAAQTAFALLSYKNQS